MIHTERTLDIDASAAEVWSVLGRFMHMDDFAPQITRIDALTPEHEGTGAIRLCHFTDGTSVVEEVIEWKDGRRYRVRMTDIGPMPLDDAYATLSVEPRSDDSSTAKIAMDYRVKFGPLGWLMGQTVMRAQMSRIFDRMLKGLRERVEERHPRRQPHLNLGPLPDLA